MKRLQVRIHHSTHPPFKLRLRPGTKVSDVLVHLNLTEDCLLFPLSDPSKTFTSEEDLYGDLANDQQLITTRTLQPTETYAYTFY